MNKRTNLGNMYLENTYINMAIIANANVTWFMKKNGTNWGIFLIIMLIVTYLPKINKSLWLSVIKHRAINAIKSIIIQLVNLI